ncbi:MAG: hypothetical protein AAFQ43_03055 [Bacteroidota bacterium]
MGCGLWAVGCGLESNRSRSLAPEAALLSPGCGILSERSESKDLSRLRSNVLD